MHFTPDIEGQVSWREEPCLLQPEERVHVGVDQRHLVPGTQLCHLGDVREAEVDDGHLVDEHHGGVHVRRHRGGGDHGTDKGRQLVGLRGEELVVLLVVVAAEGVEAVGEVHLVRHGEALPQSDIGHYALNDFGIGGD